MSVQVENLEKNMAKLTIEVSAEELEKAIEARIVVALILPTCRIGLRQPSLGRMALTPTSPMPRLSPHRG